MIEYGEPVAGGLPSSLEHDIAKRIFEACESNDSFHVLELRFIDDDAYGRGDIVVVNCINDQVPTRNEVGIKVREPLALVFYTDRIPEVRALRADFPRVPHLNQVGSDEPKSLCLYNQSWTLIERTWTPQKHLKRILWWLSESASGTLHADSQPLEPLFYTSPFIIVFPPDFQSKVGNAEYCLAFEPVKLPEDTFKILRGVFLDKDHARKNDIKNIAILDIQLPPILSGLIDSYPLILAELYSLLLERGFDLYESIRQEVWGIADGGELAQEPLQKCLLMLRVPLIREEGGDVERVQVYAFLMTVNVVEFGLLLDAVETSPDHPGYIRKYDFGAGYTIDVERLGLLGLFPVEVRYEVDPEKACELSGGHVGMVELAYTLLGVGALGGVVAELASKSGWGKWTYIDPDIVEPHNTVRHLARNLHIGLYKCDAVSNIINANFYPGYYSSKAIPDCALNTGNQEVSAALAGSTLNIDATTTLEVPRDLADMDGISRCASIFLTPTGNDSVLMMEDVTRDIRLHSLEAQYYRAVITSEWGMKHLSDNYGQLWVGAGCRDASAVMSFDAVCSSASAVSKKIRKMHGETGSKIIVWEGSDNESLIAHDIPVVPTITRENNGWRVIYDEHVLTSLKQQRNSQLPKETGGIIIGYVDQKSKTIYIVDALPAPYDSKADYSGFTRGVEGLKEALDAIKYRTADIVDYVGEWHSHPAFSSAAPSSTDWRLINRLASVLSTEGLPALMMIVGEGGDISITVR